MAKLTLRQIQTQMSSASATWEAGATLISELSEAQQNRRLGLRVNEEDQRRIDSYLRHERPSTRFMFSKSRDWRNKDSNNWTTSIKDQGNCGSCVAFATVATIEAQARIQCNKPDWKIDLSEADLFFCGAGLKCEEGWWPTEAMEYARTRGVSEESCFPYQDHDMECQSLQQPATPPAKPETSKTDRHRPSGTRTCQWPSPPRHCEPYPGRCRRASRSCGQSFRDHRDFRGGPAYRCRSQWHV